MDEKDTKNIEATGMQTMEEKTANNTPENSIDRPDIVLNIISLVSPIIGVIFLGGIGVVLGLLVGVILYFVNHEKYPHKAKSLIIFTGVGLLIAVVIVIATIIFEVFVIHQVSNDYMQQANDLLGNIDPSSVIEP